MSTTTATATTATMTPAQLTAQVKPTMQVQQTTLLRFATENALKKIREEQKKSDTTTLNTIDAEIEKSRRHEHYDWQNKINRSNFDELRQIEQLWERTEKFVGALDVADDQKELKAAALKYMEEGKRITHDRLKLIRFADRDGWSAELNFPSDDIAENEKEKKRMKRGREEAEKSKERGTSKRNRSSSSGYEHGYSPEKRGRYGER